MMRPKIQHIIRKKGVEKLSMITCYDYSFARAIHGRVDMILIGDSMGHVILGYDRTSHVSVQDIVAHLSAVRRGAPDTFIIADLPAGSYDTKQDAIKNAKILLNSGADAVKPEGSPNIVRALTSEGIDVMGHLGYLPQTAEKFRVVGREHEEATRLVKEAEKIANADAFSLVLECIPASLAAFITQNIAIPTIGIGSGVECDGQVLVLYDMLGLFTDFKPKFVRRYADMATLVANAVDAFVDDIKQKRFPSENEEYS
jgi:3-methyl-2-oxobutanoate hydroxymethyltransferase